MFAARRSDPRRSLDLPPRGPRYARSTRARKQPRRAVWTCK